MPGSPRDVARPGSQAPYVGARVVSRPAGTSCGAAAFRARASRARGGRACGPWRASRALGVAHATSRSARVWLRRDLTCRSPHCIEQSTLLPGCAARQALAVGHAPPPFETRGVGPALRLQAIRPASRLAWSRIDLPAAPQATFRGAPSSNPPGPSEILILSKPCRSPLMSGSPLGPLVHLLTTLALAIRGAALATLSTVHFLPWLGRWRDRPDSFAPASSPIVSR
jgi:hypothetical protein